MSTTLPDLVWRSEISGLLADLSKEVLALTEVVMQIAVRCEALEQAANGEDSLADGERGA